jgi:uncharacterized membrane protein
VTNLYSWLKVFHLVGLAAFLLGHGVSAGVAMFLRGRAVDAATGPLLKASMGASAVTYPGLFVLLATGVWMGFAGSFWHQGWIWAAIVVLVAVLVVMSALSVPYHQARDAVGKAKDSSEVETSLRRARPIALLAVGSAGLLIIIFLMVVKPF